MLPLRQIHCVRLDRVLPQASSLVSLQPASSRALTASDRLTRVSYNWRTLYSTSSVSCKYKPIHFRKLHYASNSPSALSVRQSTPKPTAHGENKRLKSSKQSSKDENDSLSSTPRKSIQIINQTISRLQPTRPHENIYTLPNFLTVSRLIAAPVTGYLILHGQYAWATGLLFYAGVTDLVDGWIARRWKLQTVVGSIIDPLADKALMTILTVCLAIQGGLPVWLATIILGRDVSLAIAAIYYRYASLPSPKTFMRYWDFSLPSAEVHPTGISKANTLLQLLLIGAATALPVAGPSISTWLSSIDAGLDLDTLVKAAQYTVATTTVWSGASYLYTRKAVKILGTSDEASKRKILVRGKAVLGVSFLASIAIALALESM